MSGCSDPSITSLGTIFEIEEVRDLPWNTVPDWLWYGFLSQGAEATCEFLSSPETSFLNFSWKIAMAHPFQHRGCRPYLIPLL